MKLKTKLKLARAFKALIQGFESYIAIESFESSKALKASDRSEL